MPQRVLRFHPLPRLRFGAVFQAQVISTVGHKQFQICLWVILGCSGFKPCACAVDVGCHTVAAQEHLTEEKLRIRESRCCGDLEPIQGLLRRTSLARQVLSVDEAEVVRPTGLTPFDCGLQPRARGQRIRSHAWAPFQQQFAKQQTRACIPSLSGMLQPALPVFDRGFVRSPYQDLPECTGCQLRPVGGRRSQRADRRLILYASQHAPLLNLGIVWMACLVVPSPDGHHQGGQGEKGNECELSALQRLQHPRLLGQIDRVISEVVCAAVAVIDRRDIGQTCSRRQ